MDPGHQVGRGELSRVVLPELSPAASPNMALSDPARMGQRRERSNLSAVSDAQAEKGGGESPRWSVSKIEIASC